MLDNARRYELLVRPRGRSQADEYFHDNAIWIEGREGNTYTIDIVNHTYQRALFIVSVDGLDVLKGKAAGTDSEGYVVEPHQTVSIPGWKLNNQEAAEFFFSRDDSSYVNAIGGNTSNTGVIGAMIFTEYQPYSYGGPFDIVRYYSGNENITRGMALGAVGMAGTPMNGQYNTLIGSGPILSANAQISAVAKSATPTSAINAVSQDIGTGFGDSVSWKTNSVNFTRSSDVPVSILAMYYNTAKNLEKMGIKVRSKRDVSFKANPFPAYQEPGCKPPRGYRG